MRRNLLRPPRYVLPGNGSRPPGRRPRRAGGMFPRPGPGTNVQRLSGRPNPLTRRFRALECSGDGASPDAGRRSSRSAAKCFDERRTQGEELVARPTPLLAVDWPRRSRLAGDLIWRLAVNQPGEGVASAEGQDGRIATGIAAAGPSTRADCRERSRAAAARGDPRGLRGLRGLLFALTRSLAVK